MDNLTSESKAPRSLTLMHVKMKGDALYDYIAKFQHLCTLAGWGEDDAGTLMLFKQGLMPGLHKAILEKMLFYFVYQLCLQHYI